MTSDIPSNGNIASVSWGDHLIFGEGDGRLSTAKALRNRMKKWRKELSVRSIHWRQNRSILEGHFFAAPGLKNRFEKIKEIKWDDFEFATKVAHDEGIKANLYVSLFDEGWPLPAKEVREVSYHNSMHCQHTSWQSNFSSNHPEFTVVDKTGKNRQWGVLCLAYPQVRKYFVDKFLNLLKGYEFDGLFVCLRSQSRPADFGDQYNFNEPIQEEFRRRYADNILKNDFDLQAWRDLVGEYLTLFLSELRNELKKSSVKLSIGVPRGDIIGPPMGNFSLHWREWIQKNLIDELIINQNSSQCPSMWHQLWPMHRGTDYTQNYLNEYNLPPLLQHIDKSYFPYIKESNVKLYVARQWSELSPKQESKILNHPAVSGLVFSSFRFDNKGPISRGDWRA